MIKINKRFDKTMHELSKEDMSSISYQSKIMDTVIDRLNEFETL